MRKRASPIPFPVQIPFVESLGLELHGWGDGHAEIRVDLDAAHLNHWEVAHGGVVMTLLDVSMAMAARSAHASGQGVATIEMKTSFMRPAQHQLRAIGRVVHRTPTLAFCEAEVLDGKSQLCARASGTFKYLRGLVPRAKVHAVSAPAPATREPPKTSNVSNTPNRPPEETAP